MPALGVQTRFNCLAEQKNVIDLWPDAVLIATGGLPHAGYLNGGADLVINSWDILSGTVPIAKNVMFFDDNIQHAGASCAEFLTQSECTLEYLLPEMMIAPDIGGTNHPAYLKSLYGNDVTITLNQRLTGITREDDGFNATIYNEYTDQNTQRRVDQVVSDNGTLPADDLYFDLKSGSTNLGEVNQSALLAGTAQNQVNHPERAYPLFRIGDSVISRDFYAAIYYALVLCCYL